jgi:NAD-dependent dihydropyrimidine dehydrogenase PreA subunit
MIRKIIKIDRAKCNGCGLCASACHEGAIGIKDGKAVLLRDDYCDGLGNCLPVCPTGAISFEEREAQEYNEQEVKKNMESNTQQKTAHPGACPGSRASAIIRPESGPPSGGCPGSRASAIPRAEVSADPAQGSSTVETYLNQWPVQIKLVPVNAPYFENANLLIAADCCAYSYGNFHREFMKNKITIIGCPKLDNTEYSEKLGAILSGNNIKSVTVVRMEVPCCAGLEHAVVTALKNSGKMIPWQRVILSTDGKILD